MNVDWALFWTAVSAIGQVAATILAICVLFYSMGTFNKSALLSHFSVLDEMYADLLKLAIDKPHLRIPNATRTPEEQQQYEFYAHLVWCFVESVYDRSRLDKSLLHTWVSAVEIETRLHRDWLERPENAYMFKDEFRKYISMNFPRKTNSHERSP